MNEHPSARQLTEYYRGGLPHGEFLWVHRHLLSCPDCAESYDIVSPGADDYAALQAALLSGVDEEKFHLTEQDALDYLRGRADAVDAELADTHLEDCSACAAMVSDLRRARRLGLTGGAHAAAGSGVPGLTYLSRLSRVADRHRLKVAASLIVVVGLAILLVSLRGGRRAGEPLAGLPRPDVPNPAPRSEENALLPKAPPPPNQGREEAAGDSYTDPTPKPPPRRKPSARTSPPSVVLRDGGGVVSLTPEGELTGLPAMPEGLRRAVAAALISGRVKTPRELAGLRGSRSVMLGEANDGIPFRLISPVGVMTADRRPVLSWSPLPGASSYAVTVTDEDHDEVAASGPLTGSEWKVPVSLATGKTYSWQVAALRDGEEVVSPVLPAPEAKFRVIDSALRQQILRAQKRYTGYHLILGVLYARAGLLDEASREFQALSGANPGSFVPPKLLRNMR